MTQTERVHALLEPVVAGAGMVLEGVTVTPAGRRRVVRVVVDLPAGATGGLDLDRVAEASRAVSQALDADDDSRSPVLGGQPYVLEVTSPGVDRPLTERRHWDRARGHLVATRVASADGEDALTGRVVDVDDAGVLLDDGTPRRVPWRDLGRGVVQVELNRPPGPDAADVPQQPDVPDDGADDARED